MQVEFAEPALIELDDAIEHYELHSSGLGSKFLNEVLETLGLIDQFPGSWSRSS